MMPPDGMSRGVTGKPNASRGFAELPPRLAPPIPVLIERNESQLECELAAGEVKPAGGLLLVPGVLRHPPEKRGLPDVRAFGCHLAEAVAVAHASSLAVKHNEAAQDGNGGKDSCGMGCEESPDAAHGASWAFRPLGRARLAARTYLRRRKP